MLRRERGVVVKHICESAQAVAFVFSHVNSTSAAKIHSFN